MLFLQVLERRELATPLGAIQALSDLVVVLVHPVETRGVDPGLGITLANAVHRDLVPNPHLQVRQTRFLAEARRPQQPAGGGLADPPRAVLVPPDLALFPHGAV